MRELNGYKLLVIAGKLGPGVSWHYSTGNDEPVCGRRNPDGSVGYIDTETALKLKGCCGPCARYAGIHGDYQGYDSVNNARYLSISNPRTEPVSEAFCAMHGEYISQCAERHGKDDGGFQETPVTEWHIFAGNVWREYAYAGMPVNLYENGKWAAIQFRHRADECKNSCTTWNADDIPRGWENGEFRPATDEDAAMAYPNSFYRGDSEQEARNALADKLDEYSGFSMIQRAGESEQYVMWAREFRTGVRSILRTVGRVYRIRQGTYVRQTFNKG